MLSSQPSTPTPAPVLSEAIARLVVSSTIDVLNPILTDELSATGYIFPPLPTGPLFAPPQFTFGAIITLEGVPPLYCVCAAIVIERATTVGTCAVTDIAAKVGELALYVPVTPLTIAIVFAGLVPITYVAREFFCSVRNKLDDPSVRTAPRRA